MPLSEKGEVVQRWFFLPDWKWEINFLIGDFSQLSLSSQFLISKMLWLPPNYIQKPICHPSHIIALVQATIISSLDYSNSFLNDLPTFILGPLDSLLNTASNVISLVQVDSLFWTLSWFPSSSEWVLTRPHLVCLSVSLWAHPSSFSTLLSLLQPCRPPCCLLNIPGILLPPTFAFVISSTLKWLLHR